MTIVHVESHAGGAAWPVIEHVTFLSVVLRGLLCSSLVTEDWKLARPGAVTKTKSIWGSGSTAVDVSYFEGYLSAIKNNRRHFLVKSDYQPNYVRGPLEFKIDLYWLLNYVLMFLSLFLLLAFLATQLINLILTTSICL